MLDAAEQPEPVGYDLVVNDLIGSFGPDPELERRRHIDSTKDALERDYRSFVSAAWGQVDARPFVATWHIDAVCDHLQAVHAGDIKRLIICQPPGTAKSLTVSVLFQPWRWGPANRPDTRFVVVSHAGGDAAPAVRDGTKARRLIETPWYQSYWADRFQFTEDQNAKDFYVNTRHGYRQSSGVSGVTGTRADVLLLDDVLKPGDRLNMHAIKKFQEDWPSLEKRLADGASSVILVMHRLNADDPAGFFLQRQQEEGWTLLRLPRLFEAEHRCRVFLPGRDLPFFEDPRTHDGEPLTPEHPAFKPLAVVQQERIRNGEWVFAGDEQQRPAPLTGGIIHLDWVRRWAAVAISGQDRLPNSFDALVQSWDCAFKKGELNSWVVGQVWGRKDARAYLLDQVRGHWSITETMRELVLLSERWPGTGAKLVEDKANGPAVIQMLGHVVPGLIGVEVKDSKASRMMAVSPFFESGNVFLPEDGYAAWVAAYVAELTLFPGGTANDQADATSQGVWRLLGGLATAAGAGTFAEWNADVPRTGFTLPEPPRVDTGSGNGNGAGIFSGGMGGAFDLDAIRRQFGR